MNKINQTSNKLLDLLSAANKGVQELAKILSSHLSLPIIVTNPHYRLMASASSDSMDIYSPLSFNQAVTVNTIEHLKDGSIDRCELVIDDIVYTSWKTTIIHEDETLGFLFFIMNNDNILLEEHVSLFEYATALFVIPLQKKKAITQEKKSHMEPYLFDLLYGNIKQSEEIIEHGKLWGWDFSKSQTAIVFSLADFQHITVDKQMIETMLLIVNDHLMVKQLTPITIARRNQVTVLLTTLEEKKSQLHSFIETFCITIKNEMNALFPDRNFVCGIGKTYTNPTNIFRSFQEAKVSLEIGQRFHISIPFFEELGIERILYKHDLQDLKEFYDTTLRALIDYDENNNMELMDTLEAFTQNQFDITATSKALFLHRNTLRYRLKKIEEILDIQLDDWNNKLKIVTAFKIKQLGKV